MDTKDTPPPKAEAAPEDAPASESSPVEPRPAYQKPRIKLHGNLRLMTQLD